MTGARLILKKDLSDVVLTVENLDTLLMTASWPGRRKLATIVETMVILQRNVLSQGSQGNEHGKPSFEMGKLEFHLTWSSFLFGK